MYLREYHFIAIIEGVSLVHRPPLLVLPVLHSGHNARVSVTHIRHHALYRVGPCGV